VSIQHSAKAKAKTNTGSFDSGFHLENSRKSTHGPSTTLARGNPPHEQRIAQMHSVWRARRMIIPAPVLRSRKTSFWASELLARVNH